MEPGTKETRGLRWHEIRRAMYVTEMGHVEGRHIEWMHARDSDACLGFGV
jgi:hypothetical protein